MSESGVIYECYKGILLNLTTFHQNLMSSVFFILFGIDGFATW